MNPFAALEISDDEEQFTKATGTEQKPPKKSTVSLTQPINRESRRKKLRSAKPRTSPSNLPRPPKSSQKESRRIPGRKDTTRSFLPRKSQPQVTTSTAEAAQEEWTDLERKAEVEVELATSTTSFRRTSTSRREKKLQSTPSLPSSRLSPRSPKNQKASPWTSTSETRESISIPSALLKRSQLRKEKSTQNGSRRKS